MTSLEKVIMNVVRRPNFTKNMIIGILVSLIPVVNLFALWYLCIFGAQVATTGNYELPSWQKILTMCKKDTKGCLIKILFIFFDFAVIVLFPIVILSLVFGLLHRSLFGVCLSLFISVPTFAYLLVSEISPATKPTPAMSSKFIRIYKLSFANFRIWVVPSLIFLSLQMLTAMSLSYFCVLGSSFFCFTFFVSYVVWSHHRN